MMACGTWNSCSGMGSWGATGDGGSGSEPSPTNGD